MDVTWKDRQNTGESGSTQVIVFITRKRSQEMESKKLSKNTSQTAGCNNRKK